MLKIKAAKAHEGKTLFDIIIDEILNKNDWYDHTLYLDISEPGPPALP